MAEDIYVAAPDGSYLQFPAGTSEDVMTAAMRSAYPPPEADSGDASAAVGRGLINGIPIVGPSLLGGVNRAVAGIRSLQNDTRYSDELKHVEGFSDKTATEHPHATMAGEIGGAVAGTAPMVAAAPAAFGLGEGALLTRALTSAGSGGILGGADAGARGHDVASGANVGAMFGAAGPVAGAAIGKGVGALSSYFSPSIDGLNRGAKFVGSQIVNESTPGKLLDIGPLASVGDTSEAARGVAMGIPGKTGSAGGERLTQFLKDREAGTGERVKQAWNDQLGSAVSPSAARNDIEERLGTEMNRRYAEALRAPTEVDINPVVSRIEDTLPISGGDKKAALQKSHNLLTDPAPPVEEGTAGVIQSLARPAQEKAPPDLARFIAMNGGLQADGDLAHLGLDKLNVPGVGKVVRPDGKPLDGFWRERLIEGGYLHPDSDGGMSRDIRGELHNLLQEQASGNKIYPNDYIPPARVDPRETALRAHELDGHKAAVVREMLGSGMSPKEIDPAAVDYAASMLHAGEELHPGNAYERAVMEGANFGPAPAAAADPAKRVPLTDARPVHDVKMTLDRLINKGDQELFLTPSDTSAKTFPYGGIRAGLNRELEAKVPGYAEANSVGSAYHGEMGAFDNGLDALGNKDVWARDIRNPETGLPSIPGYQQEAYKRGMRSSLDQTLGNHPDPLRKSRALMDASEPRDKLSAVFGKNPTAIVQARLNAEQEMRDTFAAVLRGSKTQNKQAGTKFIDEAAPGEIPASTTITGGALHMGDKLARHLYAGLVGRSKDATRDALAHLYTASGPDRDAMVQALLANRERAGKASDATARLLVRGLSSAPPVANQQRSQ